jgi:hypothetical protein
MPAPIDDQIGGGAELLFPEWLAGQEDYGELADAAK